MAENEKSLKRKALILYLEGFGFRAIAKLLELSHSTVQNWIKDYGNNLVEIRSRHKAELLSGKKDITSPDNMNDSLPKKPPTHLMVNTWLMVGIDPFTSYIAGADAWDENS